MNVQEQIIGKIEQAKAIKHAMSYAMPTKVWKVMSGHYSTLIQEACELNEAESINKNFYKNLDEINDALNIKIIEKY